MMPLAVGGWGRAGKGRSEAPLGRGHSRANGARSTGALLNQ
jgi:hypothetical protein